MDILSIGNSFSQDAQRYLHRIAKADGVILNTYNLFIGGCPLYRHYINMLSEKDAYTLEMNGESTGFPVSLTEALLNRNWDVVTLQQASYDSPDYGTYQPYLNKLAEFIRRLVPNAKLAIHQTWAYEDGSHYLKDLGYARHSDMLRNIKSAYEKAAHDINADLVLPSGEVVEKLAGSGVENVYRDTYHVGNAAGRYALGLLWYAALTGNDIKNNTFCDFDEALSSSEVEKIKQCVSDILKSK